MSDDRFRDIAEKYSSDPEKQRLLMRGLKAAREGREGDLEKVVDQMMATGRPKSGGWLKILLIVWAIGALLAVLIPQLHR